MKNGSNPNEFLFVGLKHCLTLELSASFVTTLNEEIFYLKLKAFIF